MASKKTKAAPLPPTLLYSLLTALGPEKLSQAQFKGASGTRVDAAAKREFLATVEAARKAKTPQQFEKALGGGASERLTSAATITKLTVEYKADGYTEVRVEFSDGRQIISVFPTT
jgi:hypothetical protein